MAYAGQQALRPTDRSRCVQPLCVVDSDLSDDHSRRTRKVFERLFARYGVPVAIQCDNGTPFVSVHSRGGILGIFLRGVMSLWHPARAFTPRASRRTMEATSVCTGTSLRRCKVRQPQRPMRNSERWTGGASSSTPCVTARGRASGQDARGGVQADRARRKVVAREVRRTHLTWRWCECRMPERPLGAEQATRSGHLFEAGRWASSWWTRFTYGRGFARSTWA